MWGRHRDRAAATAQAIVIEARANGGGSSYAGLPYYDLKLRARFDEQAINDDVSSRREAFANARIHGAEMALAARADDATRAGAATDAELQDLSDRWDAAMAQAKACMEAHNTAKAAGASREAQRQL